MIVKELRDRIVADVSGDLAPAESEQLLYELLQDPEARQLHQSLQRDRDQLRSLHRLSADSELANRVLLVLAQQSPIIRLPAKSAAKSARWPQFVGLALGLGLAFVLAWMISDRTRPAVVNRPDKENAPHFVIAPTDKENHRDQVVSTVPGQPDGTARVPNDNPNPPINVPPGDKSAVKPATDVLTAPSMPKLNPVEVVKPRISLPMSASDFNAPLGRDSFRNELQRDSLHRLELFTTDPSRLADDVVKNLKSKSKNIALEPLAAEAIRRKVRTGYAFYLEAYSVEELANQIRNLARESRFDTLVLTSISDGDRRELKQLMGRDPLDLSVDSKRANSDQPPLAGYGSIFPPVKSTALTKDQISYSDRRADRSPGKLRVYLILRPL